MTELFRHLGVDSDVPAGDIGVGAREVGYLFGQYKRIRNEHNGVLTGRGLAYGGSLVRTGSLRVTVSHIFLKRLSKAKSRRVFSAKRVVISGSGNVAIYACQKGSTTWSKSSGYVRLLRIHI